MTETIPLKDGKPDLEAISRNVWTHLHQEDGEIAGGQLQVLLDWQDKQSRADQKGKDELLVLNEKVTEVGDGDAEYNAALRHAATAIRGQNQ